ncbi:MAG: DUF3108 domain-containing protein [Gemmatimonadaceae bacterium]|nr:DUF3108 domain-containing protein [Gemmatimonadaceae bacterium]
MLPLHLLPIRRRRDAVVPYRGVPVPYVRTASLLGLVAGLSASSAPEAVPSRAAQPAPAASQPVVTPRIPPVGERLTYDVKFSAVRVGSGFMETVGYESVRGLNALHVRFVVRGGTFFYKVNDVLESWIDTTRFLSLRHKQDLSEGSRDRERTFEFFPERRTFSQDGQPEVPGVADPLDEGSFLYFVRRVPLEVGRTYEFPRYFKPDRNPVRIIVLRRERIRVPAGEFNTIVIQPIIKAKGLFSEGGKAQVWLTDDSTRAMVQMKSSLPIGSLNLYLREYRPATGAAPVRGN